MTAFFSRKTWIAVVASIVVAAVALLLVTRLTGQDPWSSEATSSSIPWKWWGEVPSLDANNDTPSCCTRRPSSYRRQLEWSKHTEDVETWSARVLNFVHGVLLEPVLPDVPLPVRWEDSGDPPLVERGFVRLDGFVAAGQRAPVPTYLFLPEVRQDQPFEPRGAVILIHGHDRGREQVVGYPDKYQKAMAARLAEEGYVTLAADNVSWGKHDPKGDGKGRHPKDWKSYLDPDLANGLISYNLLDLSNAITLLTGLRVVPDQKLGRFRLARTDESGGVPAVKAVGVSGLSYGAEISAYLMLDPRPVGYVVASGLIDTCDVKANDHHKCQLIPPFEGVITLWDFLLAAAASERPAFGHEKGQPWVQVQQGSRDKILRGWGKRGLVELRRAKKTLGLDRLEVVEFNDAGHEYLVQPALDFWKKVFRP